MRKSLLFLLAFILAAIIAVLHPAGVIMAVALLGAYSLCMAKPSCQLRVTLTVDEIIMDVVEAFKTEIPFLMGAFSTDFSSKTAVKGDTIRAHISTLPSVQSYDATTGFKANAANAEDLLVDVPVTMDQFKHVPIKVAWLKQLASKMPLYREAVRNSGYVLAKYIVDYALSKVVAANFTHSETVANANVVLETLETLRSDLNGQKAMNRGRFGIVSTGFSAGLQNDDRVKSSLFYGMKNGNQGYRHFENLAGFENIWEYPDFPANAENCSGLFGDKRAVVVANRRIDFSNAAAELGIPEVMQFYPITDPSTGLELTGVAWQDSGTGDAYVTVGGLFGASAGAQGGAADSITDKAAIRTKTQ